jgi:hypothetical protein
VLFFDLLTRSESVLGLLPAHERADGERLLALCRSASAASTADEIAELRIELSRVVELLGRRSTAGIPLATLGRATLATVGGRNADAERGYLACDQQLNMIGL